MSGRVCLRAARGAERERLVGRREAISEVTSRSSTSALSDLRGGGHEWEACNQEEAQGFAGRAGAPSLQRRVS